MYFVLNSMCALHRFQSTFYSKIAASCIVFLIYIAPIFINMPQQCCFFLLFELAKKTNNKWRKEWVRVHCTDNMLSFGFLLRLLPFFHQTHTQTHTHRSVYIRMLLATAYPFIRFILFSVKLFFWTNRKIWLWRAIPGFQYNYKHTPPSIYNSWMESFFLFVFS